MKKFFVIILLFLLTIFNLSPVIFADDEDFLEETILVNSDTLKQIPKDLNINSRACVVIDRNSNTILYGKNQFDKKKMASTTKIMTAIVIIENCNLSNTVEISKKAAGTGGSRLRITLW